MARLISMGLAVAAYLIGTLLFFGGNIFAPIGLPMLWADHLELPHWRMIAFATSLISASVFLPPLRSRISKTYRAAIFIGLFLTLPVLCIGLYADWYRNMMIDSENAERVIQRSFLASLREASAFTGPNRFHTHAAILRNCVPYAWSYTKMDFYILVPDIAVNVLPQEWIASCSIKRSS